MNRYTSTRTFCSQLQGPIVSTEQCCVTVLPSNKEPLPESLRIRNQLCIPYVYVPPGRGSSCAPQFVSGAGGSGGGMGSTGATGTTNANLPGLPAYIDAPVMVRTVAASETTALLGAQVLNAARNAENPDTRFAQYFPEQPPFPIEKVCPERYPNPAPVRDRFCVPQGMFAPSVPPPSS